jgi:hypothetical protein
MNRASIPIFACLLIGLNFLSLVAVKQVYAAGPNDYFDSLTARGDCYKAYSLRPDASQPTQAGNCSTPNYSKQLMSISAGGYASCNYCIPDHLTYNYASDTDPRRQDAAKIRIEPVGAVVSTLVTAIGVSDVQITVAAADNNWQSCNSNSPCTGGRLIRIDSEYMKIQSRVSPTTQNTNVIFSVNRAQRGSVAAAHSSGSGVRLSSNSLEGGSVIRPPIGTEDGHKYLITWDSYFTDSFLPSITKLTNHKWIQISSLHPGDQRWWENQMRYDGGTGGTPGFDPTKHIGVIGSRSYNVEGGPSDWLLSNGNQAGPNVITATNVTPRANNFIVYPNRWLRVWWQVDQRYNDYDLVSVWVADEVQDPVLVFNGLQMSVRTSVGGIGNTPPRTIQNFWTEYNTSTDGVADGRGDMVGYIKNFAILKDLPTDWSSLRVKPESTSSTITPTPPPPPPPATTLVGDINLDGIVNSLDWSTMNSKWGTSDTNSDINKDGIVNSIDFSMLNANWFKTA